VENNLLKTKHVITLLERSEDTILRDSLADALSVLADLGLITEAELDLMRESDDSLVSAMARLITSDRQTTMPKMETSLQTITLDVVQKTLADKFAKIELIDDGEITKVRKRWLQHKRQQEAIEMLAKEIAKAIISNQFCATTAADFLSEEADVASEQALIEGIRLAIETTAGTPKARGLYKQYQKILLAIRDYGHWLSQETLTKAFRRFHSLGIISGEQLTTLGISQPQLAGPFSANLQLIATEIAEIKAAVTKIIANPELAQYIYPVLLISGSRLKGYGDIKADIDLAVLVRPETFLDDRLRMRELLQTILPIEKTRSEIIEFWLEEAAGQLKIVDLPVTDDCIGESYWTHILFGGAWIGEVEAIRELQKKVLTLYLYSADQSVYGYPAHELFLSKLERDTLQYRLMHKGYERFNPPYGGLQTRHSDQLDGESKFWDSGYRQLATRLFANRVFLPQLLAEINAP